MTRPERLEGERVFDRAVGERVVVARIVDGVLLGDGLVELRRPSGESYHVHYLKLGFNLNDRFTRTDDTAAADD